MFFSRPNRIMALTIPKVIRGINRFPISTMVLVMPYSSVESTRVYRGIKRNTKTFELKVPTAKISVLETSLLYLSKAKPQFHQSFAATAQAAGKRRRKSEKTSCLPVLHFEQYEKTLPGFTANPAKILKLLNDTKQIHTLILLIIPFFNQKCNRIPILPLLAGRSFLG